MHGSPYGFDNSITEDFLRAHRGRFVGVAAIPPGADPVDQLDGWLPDDRVRQKLFAENPEQLYFSEK